MEQSKAEQENAINSHMTTLKTNLLQWLNLVEVHKVEIEELEDYYDRLAVEQQAYWDLFQEFKKKSVC